jgi:antitoxin FitA
MYYACMVALQIRDVPPDVRDALAERAAANGQSLQTYLLALVEADARRGQNTQVLQRFANRADGSRSRTGQTAAELAKQRRDRERLRAGA